MCKDVEQEGSRELWQKRLQLVNEMQEIVDKTGKTPLVLYQEGNAEYMLLRQRNIELLGKYKKARK